MIVGNRYIMAVSGGVDSVVLLDKLTKQPDLELIVAHFDHGIRDDSADDAVFVGELAKHYRLPFETKREELGKTASEDLARTRRYNFLNEIAKQYDGQVVTAHHADDVVETVAINLTRGTGWRGLAVLDSHIIRPLINMTKAEIIAYAKEHVLDWREDSTNISDAYLRNRIRRKSVILSSDTKLQILALRDHQVGLKRQIDQEAYRLIGDGPYYSRYFFNHLDISSAKECLRHLTHGQLTRPQMERTLMAIKTAKAGSMYQASGAVNFRFTSRNFTMEMVK